MATSPFLVMLYAVIKRLDSLREISASMYPESLKLAHIGITALPRRSTLSDAYIDYEHTDFQFSLAAAQLVTPNGDGVNDAFIS